jgi:hypothetical protein
MAKKSLNPFATGANIDGKNELPVMLRIGE